MTRDDPRLSIRYCPKCGSDRLGRKVPPHDDRERTTCLDCGYVLYIGPALAAGALLYDGDRLCMVRRAHQPGEGKWTFPGGFVDVDEAPEQAALRETLEETGCEGEIDRLLGAYTSSGPRGKRVVILVYVARAVVMGESDCWEVAEVRWFGPDELSGLDFAFDSTRRALDDYFKSAAAD